MKQGRRDLNPQPLVLETSALPIELHPSMGITRLLNLIVQESSKKTNDQRRRMLRWSPVI